MLLVTLYKSHCIIDYNWLSPLYGKGSSIEETGTCKFISNCVYARAYSLAPHSCVTTKKEEQDR